MVHDIYGFDAEPNDENEPSELAYLRRGAFNEAGREICKALNATEFDCWCSGCGGSKFFSKEELSEAINRLPDIDNLEPERAFLRDCIKGNKNGVWVAFW